MQKRLAAIKAETDMLVKAITKGGDLDALVDTLKAREREKAQIERDLRGLSVLEQTQALTATTITRESKTQLTDWRALLHTNVQQARQMIRKLLNGRLKITPNADLTWFEITGIGALESLLPQLLPSPKAVVTPAGFEPAISTLKGSRPGPG